MSIFGPSPRLTVVSLLDQFPIVWQQGEQAHSCYRTKERIREIYDAMIAAQCSGEPYQTHLAPSSADMRCCHPLREPKKGYTYGY
jgi:hypothetical protein